MKIDPTYLRELSTLSFRIKRKVFDKYVGDDVSKNTGDGLTFKDHSPYSLGDDVRKIDWKAYARTKELFVKRYEADKNVTVHALIDASASMDFGEGEENKFLFASKLALAVSYVLSKHQGRVRFATFADKLNEAHTFGGSASLQSMLATLENTKPGGTTNIAESLQAYKTRVLKTKSSVIIFSDFLVDMEQIERACSLFPRSHVTFVHVANKQEVDLAFSGDFKLQDKESNETLRLHISPRMRKSYSDKFQNHLKEVAYNAELARIKFVTVTTKEPFVENFMKLWELL